VAPKTEAIDPKRSAQMRLIRARDTKPELIVRKALHAAGLRFRLHAKDLPGKPDIIFRRKRLAIFVHGCFWHQHPDPDCKRARLPKSRQDFWEPKLNGNRSRDEAVTARLQDQGWRVIEIWECQLDQDHLTELVDVVRSAGGALATRP
jgi:DNA mismatch endonuclease (patch repair protein)